VPVLSGNDQEQRQPFAATSDHEINMFKPRPGPKFLARPSQAYAIAYTEVTADDLFRFVDYEADIALSAKYRHIFCGAQREPVAYCPNCERPLTQLLALDTADPRLELTEWDRDLPLLFCWRCALWMTSLFADTRNPAYAEEQLRERAEKKAQWYTTSGQIHTIRMLDADGTGIGDQTAFYYQVNPDNTITLLQYRRGLGNPGEPYPDYPDAFPEAPASLIRLTEEVQDAIRAVNLGELAEYLDEGGWPDFEDSESILGLAEWHQVGGEPDKQVAWYTMTCPLCGGPMPFLAQFNDTCTDPRGFVGGAEVDVLFHTCAKCFVLGAFST
jgi:hypothetical protein